jgi:hypothetical protein
LAAGLGTRPLDAQSSDRFVPDGLLAANRVQFELGQVTITEAAEELLLDYEVELADLLERHVNACWGALERVNRRALQRTRRIVSIHPLDPLNDRPGRDRVASHDNLGILIGRDCAGPGAPPRPSAVMARTVACVVSWVSASMDMPTTRTGSWPILFAKGGPQSLLDLVLAMICTSARRT